MGGLHFASASATALRRVVVARADGGARGRRGQTLSQRRAQPNARLQWAGRLGPPRPRRRRRLGRGLQQSRASRSPRDHGVGARRHRRGRQEGHRQRRRQENHVALLAARRFGPRIGVFVPWKPRRPVIAEGPGLVRKEEDGRPVNSRVGRPDPLERPQPDPPLPKRTPSLSHRALGRRERPAVAAVAVAVAAVGFALAGVALLLLGEDCVEPLVQVLQAHTGAAAEEAQQAAPPRARDRDRPPTSTASAAAAAARSGLAPPGGAEPGGPSGQERVLGGPGEAPEEGFGADPEEDPGEGAQPQEAAPPGPPLLGQVPPREQQGHLG
mmetsp:Transcript_39970/g.89642  ORF Transcript_39970/g.89642 Transcript_39970/m.89642 type:complete len:326 (+) Transcript_39970:803-1780(+)